MTSDITDLCEHPVNDHLALRERALSQHELGDLGAAERGYREVLRQSPEDYEILHALGQLAVATGRYSEAVTLITPVATARGRAADYADLASALFGAGEPAVAIEYYERAIALDGNLVGAQLNLGHALRGLGRRLEALASYESALARAPDFYEARVARADLLRELERPGEALDDYALSIALRPERVAGYVMRAAMLTDGGQFAEALSDCDRGLAVEPASAELHLCRATALLGLERFEESLVAYDRTLELQSGLAAAHAGRSGVLQHLERHAEALASAEHAVALAPHLAAAHFNRGAALRDLVRVDEALNSFEHARSLAADDASTNCTLGGLYLLMGRFEQGWDLLEWRNRVPGSAPIRQFAQPAWAGIGDFGGKTLFVHADQGFGDTLQFSRYAKLAELRGARVVMSVQNRLRRLMSTLSPTIELIGEADVPAAFDTQIALASLPRAFHPLVGGIPAERRYLSAEPDRVATWRSRLGDDGFKIGVVWQGSRIRNGAGRSFALASLEVIDRVPGVRLISLQLGPGVDQLQTLPAGMDVETLGEEFDRGPDAFLDCAAVMESLDLVITCDTAVAHLAGALGVPTWVMVKQVPDWRWRLNGAECAWYPSVRIFRQVHQGRWDGAFEAARLALTALMAARR